jgi:predicted DNA-binding protein (MmcQ/YjbR family)
MVDPKRTHRAAVRFALGLPGAREDHPWGETVAKVGAKVFAFFGSDGSPNGPGMTLKLRESNQAALGVPGAAPARYGLGKSGWVTLTLRTPGAPPLAVLCDWVEESYRLVAPKRLVAELDAQRSAAAPR